jgi:predicted RNA binding protein YcfA (HicA-like mRNA interferase family)
MPPGSSQLHSPDDEGRKEKTGKTNPEHGTGNSHSGWYRNRGQVSYEFVRQRGSHMRLSTVVAGSHSITIPAHDPLNVGTLSGIIDDVARHRAITREEVADRLFGS